MANMRVTFLGTSSGGGPTQGRSCSSLAFSVGNEVWLVDCAEGTQRQIHKAHHLEMSRISKILVTHMHIDHCAGVVPFLSGAMSIFSSRAQACGNNPEKLHIEIYGTPGLRHLIRTTLSLTHMNLSGKYVVHELHTPATVLEPLESEMPLHANERMGQNIMCDSLGFWKNICGGTGISIDAGLIVHRVMCVGYVFTEIVPATAPPARPRRVVCLGDTSSANNIVPLCTSGDIYPSLVVHEATNAWIPPHVDEQRLYGGARKTPQSVREKAIEKGHSTPDMAGEFARSVKAERLALTHFSAMFKNPSPGHPVMREIARQATAAWGRRGANAVAAHDLLWIDIPQQRIDTSDASGVTTASTSASVWDNDQWDEPQEPDQAPAVKHKWENKQPFQRGGGAPRGNWKRGRGRGGEGGGSMRGRHVDT